MWRVKKEIPVLQKIFTLELGISPPAALALINRGIRTIEEARFFLDGKFESLPDPRYLTDMDRAVSRIIAALDRGERIMVYGDYDADGITATAILTLALEKFGADVGYKVPHRVLDGHGLHEEAVRVASDGGFSLIITVDNGICAHRAVDLANQLGVDVIITDHHEVPPVLPDALAVVNPGRHGEIYPYRDLAGAGVALKLVQALFSVLGEGGGEEYIELAAIGTIADVVPLLRENRVLVREGLSRLAQTRRPGLLALMEVCGIRQIDVRAVAFSLAPHLNAPGRLGDAGVAARLLLASDMDEARELAQELQQMNRIRREMEAGILAEAWAMVQEKTEDVIVLSSPNWQPGLVGLVASRLAERLDRPCLLVALDGDRGRGSGRSRPGFNLFSALQSAAHLLDEYGGHSQAVGFTLGIEALSDLEQLLNAYWTSSGGKSQSYLELDGEIALAELSEKLVQDLASLGPFGHGNQEPVFLCRQVNPLHSQSVGKDGRHLKMRLSQGNATLAGIGFGLGHLNPLNGSLDVACRPLINEWNGQRRLELAVLDLQPCGQIGREEAPVGETGLPAPRHFLPEWLFSRMREYLQGEDDMNITLSHTGLPIPLPGGTGAGTLDELCHILAGGGKTIILVSEIKSVLELFSALALARSELADKLGCHYLGQSGAAQNRLHDLIVRGELQALITTYAALPALGVPFGTQAVAYRLPFACSEWNQALFALKKAGISKLYLLFSSSGADGKTSPLPDRDFLISLYRFIRKATGEKGPFSFSLQEVKGFLPAAPNVHAQMEQVLIGLKILTELSLIEFSHEGDAVQGRMFSAPGQKLDLQDSRTYCWLTRLEAESKDLKKMLLAGS